MADASSHSELWSKTRQNRRARFGRQAAFTLLEVMVGLMVFVIAGLTVIDVIGVMNQNSTVDRALTAARLLVGEKIAKAQTDTYTPTNSVTPVGCQQPTSGTLANQDTSDAFDFNSSPVTVIGNSVSGAVITGTMNQSVTTFEAASGSLLITFTVNFIYRGKAYSVSQSTIRTPDQI